MNIGRIVWSILLICIVSTLLLSGCEKDNLKWEHVDIVFGQPKIIETGVAVMMLRSDGVFILCGEHLSAGRKLKEGTAVLFNPPRTVHFPIQEIFDLYEGNKFFSGVEQLVHKAAERQKIPLNIGEN